MKHVYFIRIPMEGQCDLNAEFLCIILREQVFFQKMTHLPPFSAFMNWFWNPHKSLLSSTLSWLSSSKIQEKSNKPKQKGHICLKNLATSSWMTKPQKGRTGLFQKLRSILLNDKDTKKKNFWLKKIGSIILNYKNIK